MVYLLSQVYLRDSPIYKVAIIRTDTALGVKSNFTPKANGLRENLFLGYTN